MRTDRTERLLNLVLCLLGSRRPVDRATIRDVVPGYADSASDEAFERMFERDKDELRSMGIPVETILNSHGEVEGYRIDERAYEMPEVTFTSAELSVLGLAARAWNDALLSGAAQGALRKIEAAKAVDGATHGELGDTFMLAGRPASGEELLPQVWEAIRSRRTLTFGYVSLAGNETLERVVEPWGTVNFRGSWYVVGRDRTRQAPRIFRMSRMHGRLSPSREGNQFEPGDHRDVRDLVDRLRDPDPEGVAVIRLSPGRGAALRVRGRESGPNEVLIDVTGTQGLAAEIAQLGVDAMVVSPAELARAVRDRLQGVLESHAGSA